MTVHSRRRRTASGLLGADGDMGFQRLIGRGNVFHDAKNDLVCRQRFRQGLVGQYDAVAEDVGHEVGYVLGQHVVAAAQEGERPRGLDQVNGRTRAGAEGDVLGEIAEAVPDARLIYMVRNPLRRLESDWKMRNVFLIRL